MLPGRKTVEAHSPEWVAGYAGRIPDPIMRLRFLQAMAPPVTVMPEPPTFRLPPRFLLLALAVFCTGAYFFFVRATPPATPVPAPVHRFAALAPVHTGPPPDVWLVEQTASSETFSNGLRIDTRFAVKNHLRYYRAFPMDRPDGSGAITGSQPVGIVFHTTESRQAPFEAQKNQLLQRLGESLLEYVKRRHAYNFLIDRFGRVYRVVLETDAANHAGYSVWADDRWVYVNLNESFLGVALEARTRPGETQAEMSPAQLRAASMLTEMLRSRYRISPSNCVTHAQVSVNPSNMLVGYHTDWASSFPFQALGLPDNYALPLPALLAFGFEADSAFLRAAGAKMAGSAAVSENMVHQRAEQSGLSFAAYRAALRKRFQERLAEVRSSPPDDGEAP